MLASFAAMWIAPAISKAAVIPVIAGCLLLCCWSPVASLFMLMSGCSVFLDQSQQQAGFFFGITPGRLIGPFLVLRCAIWPGLPTVVRLLGRFNNVVAALMVIYFVPMFLVPIAVQWWTSLFETTLTLMFVVIAVALLSQIRDPTHVALAVVLALLLFPAYHILVWIGLMQPNSLQESTFEGVEIVRTSAGRFDSNYTGTTLASLMSTLLLCFILIRRRAVSWLCLALAGLSSLMLLETGSRAGVLVALAGCFGVAMLALRVRPYQLPERLTILSLVGILLAVAAGSQIASKGDTILMRFSSSYVQQMDGEYTRTRLWRDGIDHICAYPLGNPREWWRTHRLETHQAYLMAGVEGGVLSMLALISIAALSIWQGWWCVWFANRKVASAHGALLLLLGTTALAMCSYAMLRHYVFWLGVAYFGLYAPGRGKRPRKNSFHRCWQEARLRLERTWRRGCPQ